MVILSFIALPKGGGRRPPVKDMDDICFSIFEIFWIFLNSFGIVDSFYDPHVRKAILGVFIFIVFAYNWQIISFIVFQ